MKTQLNCCPIWKSLSTYRVFDRRRVPAKFFALTRKIWRGTWAKAAKKAENEEKVFNKNILIAVDESHNARRAVSYVGQLLGGLLGFKVTILHVIPEPEEDYFPTSTEKEKWFTQYEKKVDVMLKDYRQLLIKKGFASENVSIRSTVRYCPSMAKCILSERDETGFSTIVLGRQGLSRSEEFLFGSISSKIVNHARKCTVWIVE